MSNTVLRIHIMYCTSVMLSWRTKHDDLMYIWTQDVGRVSNADVFLQMMWNKDFTGSRSVDLMQKLRLN